MEANPHGVTAAAAPEAVVTNIKLSPVALRSGSGGAGGQFLHKNGWVAVVVLAGLGASTPLARRAWDEKVKPAASKVRARITERKSAESVDVADDHDSEK